MKGPMDYLAGEEPAACGLYYVGCECRGCLLKHDRARVEMEQRLAADPLLGAEGTGSK